MAITLATDVNFMFVHYLPDTTKNKKSELMLMRRRRAYSSYCSQLCT